MKERLGKKFWTALVIFGLIGQVAWVVENMYFNVFIYKMFNASAADISLMVALSAVAATLTTLFMGALSDYVGKRKLFICGGYIVWGISILSFAFIRMDILTPIAGSSVQAASLGVTLVIIMDCVMTFFGSTANDASFNAWMTDMGSDNNRGKIEGLNSMMPLLAILVVFGGFMPFDLDKSSSWTAIYVIIGLVVLVIGILGFFIIEDVKLPRKESRYLENLIYSFKPSVIKENPFFYVLIGAFAVFGISIQIFMPYLILYYEKSLGMTNYVFIMAPAIILAAIVTALYGKLIDMLGFKSSVVPSVLMLAMGYIILIFTRTTVPVFIGSLLMMCGYLTGMAVFGAALRSYMPENKSGQFQGIRIIGQVLVPGIIGPAIGAFVLADAEEIINSDGTTSFLPNNKIFMAALVVAMILLIILSLIFKLMRSAHHELTTEAGEKKSGDSWGKYPRPQLKRKDFYILSGDWTLNNSKIRMPFCPQSLLSGYKGRIGKSLIYKTSFVLDERFYGKKVIINFGAADQLCEVYVNQKLVGKHEGGYLSFSFDITEFVISNGENELELRVTDSLNKDYPYGKQCKKRGGMWYTPVSGIWQNVWLEPVPENYIKNIKITPDLTGINLEIESVTEELIGVSINLPDGNVLEKQITKTDNRIDIENPLHWTAEKPYLYSMTVTMGEDSIESYFALRTVRTEGTRLLLNEKPIFLHGVLDQGYYPDGIFTPAEEEEYERDILRMKELGLNCIRKHIKVEPEIFYYYCDLHGMLVVQDMVNNGNYSFIKDTALPTIGVLKKSDRALLVNKRRKEIFKDHLCGTINQLYNHPCIIAYTIFNEGWGQFESDKMYDLAVEQDATRVYDSTSGWFAQKKSDFDSRHVYFKALKLKGKHKPLFLSECGGYSYAVEGHLYGKYNNYGYGNCESKEELTAQIIKMYEDMVMASLDEGLCGCIYTQLTDVEDETNGFYTYDRKLCKVDKDVIKKMSEKLMRTFEEGSKENV